MFVSSILMRNLYCADKEASLKYNFAVVTDFMHGQIYPDAIA